MDFDCAYTFCVPGSFHQGCISIYGSFESRCFGNDCSFSELGMMHYAALRYYPSMVAASAVYAARSTFNKTSVWNETQDAHWLLRRTVDGLC